MKVLPIGTIYFVAASLLVGLAAKVSSRGTEDFHQLNIGDGSHASAAEIMEEVWRLSEEKAVRVQFRLAGGKKNYITAYSKEYTSGIPCDWMCIVLRGNEYLLNDEIYSRSQYQDHFAKYSEAAAMVDAIPFLVVAADEHAPGSNLVIVFQDLHDAGINHFIAGRW